MGQAFDRDGNVLGEAFGDTKREVFEKLNEQFKQADRIDIRTLRDRLEGSAASAEMPRYVCHKEVHALKIAEVRDPTQPGNESDGSRVIVPADTRYGSFRVPHTYVRKHDPKPGGYYVVYKDGYASFSPADVFEDGYTRV